MPSWIVPSDTHVVSDTGHTTDHNHVADDLTLINNVIPAVSGGLTGATSPLRFAGAIASGTAPASGTFAVGDMILVLTGSIIVCTVAGSPGTWVNVAGGGFTGGTLTQYLAPAVVALTFGTSIAVNAALGNDFRVTLTASTGTIANPSNPVDGQRIDFQLTQGTGGSFTVAWGTGYDFGASGAPTLSTAAGKIDIIGFIYNAAAGKWLCAGSALGF
jgi:hypothetical protein